MNFAIKPINKVASCGAPLTQQQTELLFTLMQVGEENMPPVDEPLTGIAAITANALVENACTAHDATLIFISLSACGNPAMAHVLVYALARTAFSRRTTHINHEVLVDTFPMGFPSLSQFCNYWDGFKAASSEARREGLDAMFRPCHMLKALADANVAFADKTDDEILTAYHELDDDAGDENYALPA